MTYLDIKKILEENNIDASIAVDIVSAVQCSLPQKVEDDLFVALCEYVRYIWDNVERAYTQLIADVVIDCYFHCYNYYCCDNINLTIDDLKNKNKTDAVIEAYCIKY